MPTNTTTYSFQKPVVGADEDSWGGYLNSNWDKVDDLFDGTTAITGIDINSGTIDGTVIGGSTPAAISGTTGQFSTSLNVDGAVTADGLTVDGDTLHVDSTNNRVGIGTSSPSANLDVTNTSGSSIIEITAANTSASQIRFGDTDDADIGLISYSHSLNGFQIFTNNSERLRINSTGDVGIGTTSPSRKVHVADTSAYLNLQDTNGTQGGSMSAAVILSDSANATAGALGFFGTGSGIMVVRNLGGNVVIDADADNGQASSVIRLNVDGTTRADVGPTGILAGADNTYDLGTASVRWDDVYATNGTIQTSDEREKQDIDVLSEAEHNVAVACKGLLRKFRWKDAVAEKGDDARIHFGIIAQDLKAAFEAEGLDASKYAMFIHTTWWESTEVIPAVEAVEAQDAVYEDVVIPAVLDDEGNEIEPERTEQRLVSEAVEAVEAQPERTVTHHHETQEEAPEGAVQRDLMGVRYPELLAFIIAAI